MNTTLKFCFAKSQNETPEKNTPGIEFLVEKLKEKESSKNIEEKFY